jgi:hypothetical protein
MPHRASFVHLLGVFVLCFLAVLTATCSSPSKPARPAADAPISEIPPTGPMWGNMSPVVSVKELMRDLIDPLSDNIFESVSITITKQGTVEKAPSTDKDWERIRIGAVAMAEASYLLKVPRPFAPQGDDNNSEGPDAPEISPAAIEAKLKRDPVLWNAKIEALRNVGKEVLEIVEKRDAQALWDAGEHLDEACENCHLEYWYPGQKLLMPKLRRMTPRPLSEVSAPKS